MNDVITWFMGFATFSGFAYFMTGFAISYAWWWWRCLKRHQKVALPWRYMGIAIGVAAILITSLQSAQAYTTAEQTSREQRECNIQFRAILLERAKITSENDDLSEEQRLIVFNWFSEILFPPSPWKELSVDDPVRQQYVLNRTLETQAAFRASVDRQNAIQVEREKHVYPDPTCGK